MRVAVATPGAGAGSVPPDASTSSVVLAAQDEAGAAVTTIDPLPLCQFTVPHKATHPGEYLMLCGSIPELGR